MSKRYAKKTGNYVVSARTIENPENKPVLDVAEPAQAADEFFKRFGDGMFAHGGLLYQKGENPWATWETVVPLAEITHQMHNFVDGAAKLDRKGQLVPFGHPTRLYVRNAVFALMNIIPYVRLSPNGYRPKPAPLPN